MDIFTNSIGMKFVYIPPGTFMMGSPEDEPGRDKDEKLHEVTLTKGFYLQTTEVTQKQWSEIMGENPSSVKFDDCPVECVTWHKAQRFIDAINQIETNSQYRLPTEAEWEYAARAGTQTPFYYGDFMTRDQGNYDVYAINDFVNYRINANILGISWNTRPVASFQPNAWGLYDMHGNVREWCQDWYGVYSSGAVTDPTGPLSGSMRVTRGGCWYANVSDCRSASRFRLQPHYCSEPSGEGFRLLKIVNP